MFVFSALWWGSKLCCCGVWDITAPFRRCNYTTYCLPHGSTLHPLLICVVCTYMYPFLICLLTMQIRYYLYYIVLVRSIRLFSWRIRLIKHWQVLILGFPMYYLVKASHLNSFFFQLTFTLVCYRNVFFTFWIKHSNVLQCLLIYFNFILCNRPRNAHANPSSFWKTRVVIACWFKH